MTAEIAPDIKADIKADITTDINSDITAESGAAAVISAVQCPPSMSALNVRPQCLHGTASA